MKWMFSLGVTMWLLLSCGCQETNPKLWIRHERPAHGIRQVDIEVPKNHQAVVLMWQYGEMSEPKIYGSLAPGESARLILVEEVAGHDAVYVVMAGGTNKLVLPITSRDKTHRMVTTRSPETLRTEPTIILRLGSSEHTEKKQDEVSQGGITFTLSLAEK